MKLTKDQLFAFSRGAVRAEEEGGAIRLLRFGKEQAEPYRLTNPEFYMQTFATSGVAVTFRTDSRALSLAVRVSQGAFRTYFSFDLMINGKNAGYFDNFSDIELPAIYPSLALPFGEYSHTFDLGEGEKDVTLHFPWSVAVDILSFELDDGAMLEALPRPAKKILCFGDSITHGYDALRTTGRYTARVAAALGCEEYNRGIGGDRFFPPLAEAREDFTPDYITVAYGTNDWSAATREVTEAKCRAFYEALVKNYPNTPIFAITPIWRKDTVEPRVFGPFEDIGPAIVAWISDLPNITVVDGLAIVPHDATYYPDTNVHPGDEGFVFYADGVLAAIRGREK